ncbi:MAG: carboxypeptidase-like regulatory domain-containing protein, partial [Candidatus Roizmanbacteria bacterium]
KIKVVDAQGNPVEGAEVTLHSAVQIAQTDKDGIARFTAVEPGQHTVSVSYNNFSGEQSISLVGNTKEYDLKIVVVPQRVVISPIAYVVIFVMGFLIAALIVLIMRSDLVQNIYYSIARPAMHVRTRRS